MTDVRHSLNPNAISFIPSKDSEALKDMAVKYVAEIYANKRANGETISTNEEIAKLVWHFISIRYKKLTYSDKLKIQIYLNKKLHSSNFSAVRPISDIAKFTSKFPKPIHSKQPFNLSKFQIPKLSFLLVAFWGLYRHEQAQRPLLSLTCRPDVVTDKIWSVDTSDKKLWNQSCVSNVCSCPPMFGYSLPSNFFGDLSHLHHTCPVQGIHLNHYREGIQGNEYILTDKSHRCAVEEYLFEDVIIDIKVKADVNLKEQFESTVSGLCDFLSKFADETISKTEGDEIDEEIQFTSFWDDIDTKVSHVPFSQQHRDSLVDDNDHPLLMTSYMCNEEEVPPEVAEMIRKSLSPKKDKINHDTAKDEDIVCDPPCSVWCGSVNKGKSIGEMKNVYSDTSKESHPIRDALKAYYEKMSKLEPKEKPEQVSLLFSPLLGDKRKIKPAVSDSDPFYGETKFDFNRTTAPATDLPTPETFFKKLANLFNSRSTLKSWEDADSGFVSRSSSQDDIFDLKFHEAKNSTWELVSAEDSLWQPLPECDEVNDRMNYLHKQVRNYRRQRS